MRSCAANRTHCRSDNDVFETLPSAKPGGSDAPAECPARESASPRHPRAVLDWASPRDRRPLWRDPFKGSRRPRGGHEGAQYRGGRDQRTQLQNQSGVNLRSPLDPRPFLKRPAPRSHRRARRKHPHLRKVPARSSAIRRLWRASQSFFRLFFASTLVLPPGL